MLFYSIMKRIVTLTTDFGIEDHYVGVMKGVILSINSEVNVVDITHNVDSHSIVPAAFIIKNSYKYFPKNTIHVVVIDPGVGSDRKAILVCFNNHFFIGPDNGVFSLIFQSTSNCEVYQLENEKYFLENISSTFHGRDIFSPAAAYLSKEVAPNDFGKKLTNPHTIELNEYTLEDTEIRGEVIYTDKFGNLVTNIPSNIVNKDSEITIGDKKIQGVSNYYSQVKAGKLLAIAGSSGYLEISINQGNAGDMFDKSKLNIIVRL